MRTDELISAIAADAPSVSPPISRTLWIAAVVGAIAAALYFVFDVGPRADIGTVIESPRFLYKFVLTLTLFGTAMGLILHLAHPGAVPKGWLYALAAAPILLVAAVAAEFILVPPTDWGMMAAGKNATACLILIPMLSAVPLIAMLIALRQGATTHPVLAGAVAGLVASGIGATLYAAHCVDDSAFFIATWYVLAITLVTAVGALVGSRLLRW